ncbi:acyl CoA binding protein-domain-containing protein [Xylariaceae sp. FL1019]|nr:acyl CoA binding protein-domain-containing protein [Xylariaceae sp. FL1019]
MPSVDPNSPAFVANPAFKKAADESGQLTKRPTDDELLELYGLFKVGLGDNFAAAEKPGMFNLKEKYKYQSWEKFAVTESLSQEQAQEKYIAKVEELKSKYA